MIKNEARRQEQRGPENFSVIEIAPKISQILVLHCSKIRTFTQGLEAKCRVRHRWKEELRSNFRRLTAASLANRPFCHLVRLSRKTISFQISDCQILKDIRRLDLSALKKQNTRCCPYLESYT